jgi:hypothetical protein
MLDKPITLKDAMLAKGECSKDLEQTVERRRTSRLTLTLLTINHRKMIQKLCGDHWNVLRGFTAQSATLQFASNKELQAFPFDLL